MCSRFVLSIQYQRISNPILIFLSFLPPLLPPLQLSSLSFSFKVSSGSVWVSPKVLNIQTKEKTTSNQFNNFTIYEGTLSACSSGFFFFFSSSFSFLSSPPKKSTSSFLTPLPPIPPRLVSSLYKGSSLQWACCEGNPCTATDNYHMENSVTMSWDFNNFILSYEDSFGLSVQTSFWVSGDTDGPLTTFGYASFDLKNVDFDVKEEIVIENACQQDS